MQVIKYAIVVNRIHEIILILRNLKRYFLYRKKKYLIKVVLKFYGGKVQHDILLQSAHIA